eukprot:UN1221
MHLGMMYNGRSFVQAFAVCYLIWTQRGQHSHATYQAFPRNTQRSGKHSANVLLGCLLSWWTFWSEFVLVI